MKIEVKSDKYILIQDEQDTDRISMSANGFSQLEIVGALHMFIENTQIRRIIKIIKEVDNAKTEAE